MRSLSAISVKERVSQRRLHGLSVSDHRLRPDMDVQQQSAELSAQRRGAGSPEQGSADRRKRSWCVRVDRCARYGFNTQGMNYHLFGDAYLEAPNEPEALVINYYLSRDASAEAKITVSDSSGHAIRQLTGPAKRGLNRALVPLAGGGRGRGAGPATPPPRRLSRHRRHGR